MVHVSRAILYFDGTSVFNPSGPAGAGYEIVEMNDNGADGMTIVEGSVFLGHGCSNAQAGYHAFIAGLRCVRDNLVVDKLYIRGDSKTTMRQLQGLHNVRSNSIAPLYDTAMKLLKDLSYLDIRFTIVDPAKNYRSDDLANLAITEGCDNMVWYR